MSKLINCLTKDPTELNEKKNEHIIQKREKTNAIHILKSHQQTGIIYFLNDSIFHPSDWQIFKTTTYGMGIRAFSYPLPGNLNGT